MVLLVGLIVVIATLAYAFFFAPQVEVTGINFASPDNACGLDGATDDGFNATPGDSFQLTYSIPNNSSALCTISAVTTSTPGFSISGANVPLAIPANGSQLLSFSVNLPNSAYVGILTLVIT